MTEAVALAKLHPPGQVDRALGTAAVAGRFAENDVLRILAHQAGETSRKPPTRASETHSLQPGTSAWSGFGVTPADGHPSRRSTRPDGRPSWQRRDQQRSRPQAATRWPRPSSSPGG